MKYLVLVVALFASAFAVDEPIPILKQDSDVSFDGTFHNTFETKNGIIYQEHGHLKNAGNKETEAQEITGTVDYTAPDGTPVHLSWVADETGFHPEGSHLPVGPSEADLPTPPPIPAAIQKALDYIAAHPPPPEKN